MNDLLIMGHAPKDNVDISKLDWCKTEIVGDLVMFETGDYDATWPEHVLDDLIDAFGKPLDEAEGLNLHVEYRDFDGGCNRYLLEIIDGRCFYYETELVEHSMSKCMFRIR